MSDTPRTDALEQSWNSHALHPITRSTEATMLARQLERELAEANHHRAVFEALWTGASEVAGGDPVQRIYELRKELADLSRPAKLANPLYEVLCEMDSLGGSFVQSLAACFSNADPENRQKLMVVFRPTLERYDAMIPTKPCQRCGGCFMLPGEGPNDDVMNTPCPDCNPQPPTTHPETPVV